MVSMACSFLPSVACALPRSPSQHAARSGTGAISTVNPADPVTDLLVAATWWRRCSGGNVVGAAPGLAGALPRTAPTGLG